MYMLPLSQVIHVQLQLKTENQWHGTALHGIVKLHVQSTLFCFTLQIPYLMCEW